MDRAAPPRRQHAPDRSRRVARSSAPRTAARASRARRCWSTTGSPATRRSPASSWAIPRRRPRSADASRSPIATSRSAAATRTSSPRPTAQGRTSAPSRRLSLAIIAAPEAPEDVRAVPGEREVHLSWRPPTRLTDGGPVETPLIYEVLRATGRRRPARRGAPDRAGRDHRAGRQSGERSRVLLRDPVRPSRRRGHGGRDEFGPRRRRRPPTPRRRGRPPRWWRLPRERSVRLSWTPSPDPDVIGYVVYRASADGSFERVGSVRAPATTFTDRDVAARRSTATPSPPRTPASRANESVRSNEATVTVP